MNNQSTKSGIWSDLRYGFKTYLGKPPRMHRGVYWARNISLFILGMLIYAVAKNLLTCECDCDSALSMNAINDVFYSTPNVEIPYISELRKEFPSEHSSSSAATIEMIS